MVLKHVWKQVGSWIKKGEKEWWGQVVPPGQREPRGNETSSSGLSRFMQGCEKNSCQKDQVSKRTPLQPVSWTWFGGVMLLLLTLLPTILLQMHIDYASRGIRDRFDRLRPRRKPKTR